MGQLRIISGKWRSRRIGVVDRPGLRPTADRARETLFNWLSAWLPWEWDAIHVLDAYAGSGALGLEAASRGAASVTLVENDATVIAALRDNIRLLQAGPSVTVVPGNFLAQARLPRAPFSLIFLDPPFADGQLGLALTAAHTSACNQALVYVESPLAWPFDLSEAEQHLWSVVRQGKTGKSFQTLLQKP